MSTAEFTYPRRVFTRSILRQLISAGFSVLTDLHIEGKDNIPEEGPLLIVGNHFSFVDPAAMIRTIPQPLEFIGGHIPAFAPLPVRMFPKLWGILPVFRGTGSREALRASEEILKQNGMLGIFPEGGSWAQVLRPARPGTAYLAARTKARILPIGIIGATEVFPSLSKWKRARVILKIGKPFGPFEVSGKGRDRRQQLDEIGDEIMLRIADLLPADQQGVYSDDPAIREAAKEAAIYPWENAVEGEVS